MEERYYDEEANASATAKRVGATREAALGKVLNASADVEAYFDRWAKASKDEVAHFQAAAAAETAPVIGSMEALEREAGALKRKGTDLGYDMQATALNVSTVETLSKTITTQAAFQGRQAIKKMLAEGEVNTTADNKQNEHELAAAVQAGEVAALARVETRLGRSLTAAFENRTAEALAAQKRTSRAVRQATGATAKREVATARVLHEIAKSE